ncbi:hypothetical protein BZG36_05228 [Bifiguratus adelaidae]|uniref:C2H2-type domain-containing protein n=1 Tax=Bifiguratus adelaidae TaxID=1938954 RepID=A0A261XUJ9_9FUNG|nr:hypothetical protein BZG36_05228 [Bifiguratus adelaidae]
MDWNYRQDLPPLSQVLRPEQSMLMMDPFYMEVNGVNQWEDMRMKPMMDPAIPEYPFTNVYSVEYPPTVMADYSRSRNTSISSLTTTGTCTPSTSYNAHSDSVSSTTSNNPATPPAVFDPNDLFYASKIFNFVALPGVGTKKRPRRRYNEIERLYACNYPGCTKSYGTLNHLNAHVSMQGHGPKRLPAEFKDMRKQRRKQKREEATRQNANNNNRTVSRPM